MLAPSNCMGQSNQAQTTQELCQRLDELRTQMAAQTKLISTLQARIDEIERTKPPAAVEEQAPPPPSPLSHQAGETTSGYQTFAQDQAAAPRVDNAPLDPTHTRIRRYALPRLRWNQA